jgi:hypothetical protein
MKNEIKCANYTIPSKNQIVLEDLNLFNRSIQVHMDALVIYIYIYRKSKRFKGGITGRKTSKETVFLDTRADSTLMPMILYGEQKINLSLLVYWWIT